MLKKNEERTSWLFLEGCNQPYSLLHTGANSKKDCWTSLELDKWSPQEYVNYNIIIYRLKLGILNLNGYSKFHLQIPCDYIIANMTQFFYFFFFFNTQYYKLSMS